MTSLRVGRSIICAALVLACAGGAFAVDHPGNVFMHGEDVLVPVPDTWGSWTAIDVNGKDVGAGVDRPARLGRLPVGYFEVLEKDGPGKMTAAVVAPNTPLDDTPIAIDCAMSWFYAEPGRIRAACTLAKLGGVRWVRDRASWPELETARGVWAAPDATRYERAMKIQREMGMKILQVNHISPPWAAKDPKKFPDDLRDVYNFYKGLAQRWKGLADAIEPWNEPDLDVFGGHTGCEIASFQKAAYLGLKAGDPDAPVSGTVFAIDRAETLDDFAANDAFPYFDRYGLHHYIRLHEYPRAYARHRAVSGGRPMWTTEFNLTVQWHDEKTKEPNHDELRVQGYRVGKVFAQALHEGPEKLFYFILGDYVERDRQFGLVHGDLTPRPAYVAFAGVGRLLNGAKPLGRVDFGDEKLKAFVFSSQVDGVPRETVVAWSESNPTPVDLPGVERTFDYLGREQHGGGDGGAKVRLARETLFMLLPPGGSKRLKLVPPPEKPKWRDDIKPVPVVLQLIGTADEKQSAFVLGESTELRLVAYNFGDQPASGTLTIEGTAAEVAEVAIPGGGRHEQPIETAGPGRLTARFEFKADSAGGGSAIVSGRVVVAGAAAK